MANINTLLNAQFGEYITFGYDFNGNPSPGEHVYPCYTCGHCSVVIVIRPDRAREREKCGNCGKFVCEKNEICRTQCVPLRDLAVDHLENAKGWDKFLPAILGGATSLEEAYRRNLVIGEP